MQYDLIIVGGGTAGLTAALYARRGGLSVLLVEGAAPGGQIVASPLVENYPALPGVSGADYAVKLLAQVQEVPGADFQLKYQQVIGFALADGLKKLQTAKAEYTAPALIWAAGVTPRRLGCPGEERFIGRGVSFCATCDGPLYRGKTAVVVGGGNTALTEALFLAGLCDKVHLLHRRAEFRAEMALQRQVLANERIICHLQTEVLELTGENSLTGLLLQKPSGEELLPADGVFLAIGKQPDNNILRPYVRLDEDGYIIAGEDCQTGAAGLFAAGDCRTKPLRQLVTAAADGAVAATAAVEYLSGL